MLHHPAVSSSSRRFYRWRQNAQLQVAASIFYPILVLNLSDSEFTSPGKERGAKRKPSRQFNSRQASKTDRQAWKKEKEEAKSKKVCVSVCLSDIGRRLNLIISYVCLSVRWVYLDPDVDCRYFYRLLQRLQRNNQKKKMLMWAKETCEE